MSWLTNSVTKVKCDDDDHRGPKAFDVSTSYSISARTAMIQEGWGYDHVTRVHVCPTCISRNRRRN